MYYYNIILFGLIDRPLLYKNSQKIKLGTVVSIFMRKKKTYGVIVSEVPSSKISFDKNKILLVSEILNFIFKSSHLNFINHLAKYYFINLGMAYKISIGSELNLNKKIKKYLTYREKTYQTKKELIEQEGITNKDFLTLKKENYIKETEFSFLFNKPADPFVLNTEQTNIYNKIIQKKNKKYSCHLINGVTGSGKTELYFKFVYDNLINKNQVLVLLPEIALTEDWTNRFYKYFGCMPFIWHSKQSNNQKSRILNSIISGEPCVVVGARSSVLLPFQNLKLVICDEEHDSSYKQEDGPRYNARDMAILKASKENALCLLVSASPSLETLQNIRLNKINQHHLFNQYFKTSLPIISLIDMNSSKPSSTSWISRQMFEGTKNVLEKNGQVLFFLNRRGYAPTSMCSTCHSTIQCKNCASNLVHHKSINKLICHQCSKRYDINQKCLQCNGSKFVLLGIGLERLQDEVSRLFPGKKSQIFSSDTLKNKINKNILFNNVYNNTTKILIGSQIVGKSFHFSNLKLVNIVDGDTTLHSPDFRALEKTYQLFQQVAGRSGREGEQGDVLIQTYNPNHPLFQSLINQNRNQFIDDELNRRRAANLPPFFKIGVINILHKKPEEIRSLNSEIIDKAQKLKIQIYGPTPALIPYKKGHFHEFFFIKEPSFTMLADKISLLRSSISVKYQRFFSIDIDPLNIS